MQKVKKLLFIYLSLLLAISSIVYLFTWINFKPTSLKMETSTSTHAVILAAQQIENYWLSGLWPKEVESCSDLIDLIKYLDQKGLKKERYLQCEPKALTCYLNYLQNIAMKVTTSDRKEWQIQSRPLNDNDMALIRYHKDLEVKEASKLIYFELLEATEKKSHLFSLEDSCRDRKLKEGLHPYAQQRAIGQDFIWDNKNRALYIDRFLVSKGEFFDWLYQEEGPHPFLAQNKLIGLERFQIVENIPLQWQLKYCEAHGKTVLQSHIADGASFFPAQLQTEQIMVYPRGPYPQGRRILDSYIGGIITKKESEIDLSRLCSEIFTQECLKQYEFLLARLPFALSYQGIEQVLGGMPEATINKIEPSRRLHLSSQYFSFTSDVHRLGKRFEWDGESFDRLEFNLSSKDEAELPQTIGIGFRCMKVSTQ